MSFPLAAWLADSDNGRPPFGSDPDAARPASATVGFTGARVLSRAAARPSPRSGADRADRCRCPVRRLCRTNGSVSRHPVRHARPGDRGPRRPGAGWTRRARSGRPRPGPRPLVRARRRPPGGGDRPARVARRRDPGRAAHPGRGPRRHHRGAARRARSRPAGPAVPRHRLRPGERAAELARHAVEALSGSSTRASRRPSAPASAPPRPATTSSVACSPGSTCSASTGAHGRLGAAVAPLLSATTRSSRHLLAAAVAGRYTEGLIGLAAALASASAPAVRDALGVPRPVGRFLRPRSGHRVRRRDPGRLVAGAAQAGRSLVGVGAR